MLKIKHFIEQSWLLIVASFIFGLLIAVTYASWQPIIEQNQIDKLNNLMKELINDANSFDLAIQAAEITSAKGKPVKTDIYKASDAAGNNLGYAFIAVGPGFADKIKLVIAIDKNCEKLFGFKVLFSNETPGFGSKIVESFYNAQFELAPAANLELSKIGDPKAIDTQIVAISGATVSSEAVVKIFNTYIVQIKEIINKD